MDVAGKNADPALILEALEQVAQTGTPGPAHASVIDVGTSGFLRYFEREILDGLVGLGGATCRFFEGPYGAGKTHLLALIAAAAVERGMAVARTDLSQAMSMHDWRSIAVHVLEHMEVTIEGEAHRSLPRILQALRKAGWANLPALRAAALPHPGFQRAMLWAVEGWMLGDYPWDLLRRYLLGEKVAAGVFKKVGLAGVKDPLTQRNAEQVLSTVVTGLFHLGLPGTLLLFDENERTLVFNRQQPPKRLVVAANLIRRLIDGCTTGALSGTVAVFAVLPGFLDGCTLTYPALGQRLHMPRGDTHTPAWRWPVMPVETACGIDDPEEFMEQVIQTFCGLVTQCGASADGLPAQLRLEGSRVLQAQAGSGFRRPLMKALATLAYRRLEGAELV